MRLAILLVAWCFRAADRESALTRWIPGAGRSLLLALVAVTTFAQVPRFPEYVPMEGTVVDVGGRPVAGAMIASMSGPGSFETDSSGRFSERADVPYFVIRKAGYQSARVKVTRGHLRIVLKRVSMSGRLPVCSDQRRGYGLEAPARLRFRTVAGVHAGNLFREDFVARFFTSGTRRLQHGVGLNWSNGVPEDEQVWNSTAYSEVVWEDHGDSITDARGYISGQGHWRILGIVPGRQRLRQLESASYTGETASVARQFDRVLDTACIGRIN